MLQNINVIVLSAIFGGINMASLESKGNINFQDISRTKFLLSNVLLFGENSQTVAYAAQPLCWSGWETPPPPLTGEQYGKMEPKYHARVF